MKIEDKEENFNLAKRYGEVVSMAAGSPFEQYLIFTKTASYRLCVR